MTVAPICQWYPDGLGERSPKAKEILLLCG